jgi:hypothetical protein
MCAAGLFLPAAAHESVPPAPPPQAETRPEQAAGGGRAAREDGRQECHRSVREFTFKLTIVSYKVNSPAELRAGNRRGWAGPRLDGFDRDRGADRTRVFADP